MKTYRIKDIAEIINGGTPSTSVPSFWDGDVEWLTPKDLGQTKIRYVTCGERRISVDGVEHSSAKVLPPRSVILSSRAPIGYVAINTVPMATNQGCKGLIPSEKILSEYLFYFLLKSKQLLNDLGAGATFKELSGSKLGEVCIPLPSLSEQRRIVEVLDAEFGRIDALKGNAERNLQNAKDLFQAALKKELTPKKGWNEMSLANMCKITSQLVDPQLDEYRSLVHIGGANIESETGKLIGLKTAAEEKLSSGKFVFDSTMVLYNKIRPYLKKVARPDFNGLCSADMYPLTPSKGTNKDFLYYVLMSKDFTEYAIKGSARAGMPKVNRDCLFAYRCIVPLERVQADIALRLDSLDSHCRKLQENYEKTAALCDDLKQALLRKAFNGEL